METAQIVSIIGIIIGLLFCTGGYYLIILDKKIKEQKAGLTGANLEAIPEIIKAINDLIGKPGGLGLVLILLGFVLIVYCIAWWLDPGLIPSILTRNNT